VRIKKPLSQLVPVLSLISSEALTQDELDGYAVWKQGKAGNLVGK
jgi:hypothetical protein